MVLEIYKVSYGKSYLNGSSVGFVGKHSEKTGRSTGGTADRPVIFSSDVSIHIHSGDTML